MIDIYSLYAPVAAWTPVITSWLLTYAVHSSIIFLLVAGVHRLIRHKDKSLHNLLWKFALVGGILSTSAQQFSGWEPLAGKHIFSAKNPAHSQVEKFVYKQAPDTLPDLGNVVSFTSERRIIELNRFRPDSAVDAFSFEYSQATLRQTSDLITYQFQSRNDASDAAALIGNSMSTGQPIFRSRKLQSAIRNPHSAIEMTWMDWLMLAWIAGMAVGLGRLISTRRWLKRQLMDRVDLNHPLISAQFDPLLQAARIGRPVRLTVSQRLRSPIVVSMNEICLPERALSELTTEEQRSMLAHEIAHVMRGDHLWLQLSLLLDTLFFFQPLNRISRRQFQESAEFLCDDWAVDHASQKVDLARCLTKVAGWITTGSQPVYLSAMSANGSVLKQRVMRILQPSGRQSTSPAKRLFLPLLVLLIILISGLAPAISAEMVSPEMFVVFKHAAIQQQRSIQSPGSLRPGQRQTGGTELYINISRSFRTNSIKSDIE